MKKILLFSLLVGLTTSVFCQDDGEYPGISMSEPKKKNIIHPVNAMPDSIYLGEKPKDVDKALEDGYTLKNRWTIEIGDTLQLGIGTLPDKKYAFIYQSPLGYFSETSMNLNKKAYLNSVDARFAVVKDLLHYGLKKNGYTIIAKVGVGDLSNYWIEIDNAYNSGEIIAPSPYTVPMQSFSSQSQLSGADELKKWKNLLDSGVITQQEFDVQKKKILGE